MGARPIAVLDSLRFGPITADGFISPLATRHSPLPSEIAANRRILDGVIRASEATEIVSAFPLSAAKSLSSRAMRKTRSSTRSL